MRENVEIEIIGYVATDPVMPSPDKYPDFITFQIAITNKQDTTWFKCQTGSEGLANVVKSYVKKADGVLVKGYPKINTYLAKDGTAKGSIEINISYLNLLGSYKNKSNNNPF
jgi:single-stranded DNA-binding protein